MGSQIRENKNMIIHLLWALQQRKPVLALQDPTTPEGVLARAMDDPLYGYVRTSDFAAATTKFLKYLMKDE